ARKRFEVRHRANASTWGSLPGMHNYDLTLPQLTKTLRTLDRWLTLADKHAQSAQISVATLLDPRLGPDQYASVRTIQVACDNAKFMAGRLAGKEWPSHPDTETTIAELRGRIEAVIGYLATFSRADFESLADRKIRLPWMPE